LIVKIIQAITCGQDIHPEIHKVLTENTHNVKYDDEELDTLLLEDICKRYNIKLLDSKPFHAGMISIVYLGEINDKKVVIKMKRTNIVERITVGSNNVNFIYELLHILCSFDKTLINKLDSLKTITKTQEYLISQCDFVKECDVLITTKREISSYSMCDNIVIPSVYNTVEDLKTNDFIIMEFLDGKFATEITELAERKLYYKLFGTFIVINTWFCSYFHTDMHNGNIICIKDGDTHKIGIIDFGMSVQVTKDIKAAFQNFADIAYTTGFENAKLGKYINLFIQKPIDLTKLNDEQMVVLDKAIGFMAHKMQNGELNEQHVNEAYTNISSVLIPQFEVTLNMDFTLLILGVSMGNSTVRIMVNHDAKIVEETLKEVYFEMME
jgi:predicted unusual protein kinase regulating ubiquinone biosynthesis (AarF/ABC1/UbiB family)